MRWIAGSTGAVALAAVLVGAPAIGATEQRAARKLAIAPLAAGAFTPAAADPRLAALLARAGVASDDFRFTPSESRRSDRAVTVAVRSRAPRLDAGRGDSAAVGLAPIAYNLGVAVGWKRFALSTDVARVDLAGQPGGREAMDVGVSYAGKRLTGRVVAAADRALPGAPKLIETDRSYSLDVGGSYALARNLDLTAGVRYRTDRDRLTRVDDDRRDSQAVYVGTAFRF